MNSDQIDGADFIPVPEYCLLKNFFFNIRLVKKFRVANGPGIISLNLIQNEDLIAREIVILNIKNAILY